MSESYSSSTRRPGFFRSLVLLLLFVTGIVSLMVVLSFYQTNLSQLLMTIFAITGIGLATGLGSRAVFYERSGFTRFFLALVILPLGLFALGYFTNWQMGVGPLEPWLAGRIDWFELAQLGGGLLVTILALRAWWKPVVRTEEAVPIARRSSKRKKQARTASSVQLPRFNPPHFQFPEIWTARPKGSARLKLAHRSNANERVIPEVERVIVSRPAKPARSKRRKLSQRKPELQLSVYEEHRCPYCLEEVKRNDARGVKECEVCHSLHHADCWNITGMCQVPHLNS